MDEWMKAYSNNFHWTLLLQNFFEVAGSPFILFSGWLYKLICQCKWIISMQALQLWFELFRISDMQDINHDIENFILARILAWFFPTWYKLQLSDKRKMQVRKYLH